MIWRGIVIMFIHSTVVMLVLSGFTWLEQGFGLHPLIAFPSAMLIFVWTWLWIYWEASQANCKVEDYLEWLDEQAQEYEAWAQQPEKNIDTLKGGLIQIIRSQRFWNDK